jgi:hypothetical protein
MSKHRIKNEDADLAELLGVAAEPVAVAEPVAEPAPAAKPAVTSAELKEALVVALEKAPALEAQWGKSALEAMRGVEGAEERAALAKQAMAQNREHVEMLKALLVAAAGEEQASRSDLVYGLAQTRISSARQHISARNKHARAVAKALAYAAKHYRLMIEKGEKIALTSPLRAPDMLGTYTNVGAIRAAVANEIWRNADLRDHGYYLWPNSEPPSPKYANCPLELPRLEQVLADETAFLKAKWDEHLYALAPAKG